MDGEAKDSAAGYTRHRPLRPYSIWLLRQW